jgi:hypothetical protein
MPKTGKKADIICRNATLARPPRNEREVAESGINTYVSDPHEKCETRTKGPRTNNVNNDNILSLYQPEA